MKRIMDMGKRDSATRKALRRPCMEALEDRRLMSITSYSLTLDNYTPPVDNGSAGVTPGSLLEGHGQSVTLVYTTDHDNAIANFGAAEITVDYGDPNDTSGNTTFTATGNTPISLSHVYSEEGNYSMNVTIKEKPGDGYTYAWTVQTVSTSAYLSASEAPLNPTGQINYTFEPNTTLGPVQLASFHDMGATAPDMKDYVGTINWGDGTTSAATFVLDLATKDVDVFGTHMYHFAIDPNTGEVARPVARYGGKVEYPIGIHVMDAGGGAMVDFALMGRIHLGVYIETVDFSPMLIHVAAPPTPIVVNFFEMSAKDEPTAILAPPALAILKPIAVTGGTITATVALGPPAVQWESLTVTRAVAPTPSLLNDRWSITLLDTGSGAKGIILVTVVP